MLLIHVPKRRLYNEATQEVITVNECTLALEHSLLSVSKWESVWKKPFISKEKKTNAELLDYIRCMTITKNVDPFVYACLTEENYAMVTQYIDDPMTASKFYGRNNNSNKIVTSELIYYWMIVLQIPFECEKWHLNRLMALIRTCNIHSGKGKKMPRDEILRQNRERNEARKQKLGTKG